LFYCSDLFHDPDHGQRRVGLAAIGFGRQIRGVGFAEQLSEGRFRYDLAQRFGLLKVMIPENDRKYPRAMISSASVQSPV
jgi:hypothetical protein